MNKVYWNCIKCAQFPSSPTFALFPIAVGKIVPLPIFCPCKYILSVLCVYYGLSLSESNTEKPRWFNFGHTAAGYRYMTHGVKPKSINHKKISYSVRREKSVP